MKWTTKSKIIMLQNHDIFILVFIIKGLFLNNKILFFLFIISLIAFCYKNMNILFFLFEQTGKLWNIDIQYGINYSTKTFNKWTCMNLNIDQLCCSCTVNFQQRDSPSLLVSFRHSSDSFFHQSPCVSAYISLWQMTSGFSENITQ